MTRRLFHTLGRFHPLAAIRLLAWATLIAAGLAAAINHAHAAVRIKDIVSFEGVRDNMLVGYGIVVGLDGTGDTLQNSPFTEQSLVGMLERLGVNVRGENLRTRNIAAVMVTATLPPFARQGSRIDVSISSLGDASSLRGGALLVTPLLGADGEVYAVGQGSIQVSGFAAAGQAETIVQGVPTSGAIPNGAIVEREVAFAMNEVFEVRMALRNPDFTTALRIADAINAFAGNGLAAAVDPGTVVADVPGRYSGDIVSFIGDIEQLLIEPDMAARVVVDEATGIIVIGQDVRISTVAIAQGNLTIRVTEDPQVSQPAPLAEEGTTVVVPRTNIAVDTGADRRLALLGEGVSLQELVNSLNALGVGPRDLISILQAIKSAGALQADLTVR
ncbi:MAG: flagellar basal body P-ring protein FlgI [Alphaproteobacteria bacterium]